MLPSEVTEALRCDLLIQLIVNLGFKAGIQTLSFDSRSSVFSLLLWSLSDVLKASDPISHPDLLYRSHMEESIEKCLPSFPGLIRGLNDFF